MGGFEIEKWSRRGESVIIMRDFNEDISKISVTDWCEDLFLRDLLTDKVGGENTPRTYQQGYLPINVIMCSKNGKVNKEACFPFENGAGDHRLLIVDIDMVLVFGVAGVVIGKCNARRLKLNDPRIIAKYSSLFHKFYVKHKLYLQVHHLKKYRLVTQ